MKKRSPGLRHWITTLSSPSKRTLRSSMRPLRLRIESLESRDLLAVTPVDFATSEYAFQASQTSNIQLDLNDTVFLSVANIDPLNGADVNSHDDVIAIQRVNDVNTLFVSTWNESTNDYDAVEQLFAVNGEQFAVGDITGDSFEDLVVGGLYWGAKAGPDSSHLAFKIYNGDGNGGFSSNPTIHDIQLSALTPHTPDATGDFFIIAMEEMFLYETGAGTPAIGAAIYPLDSVAARHEIQCYFTIDPTGDSFLSTSHAFDDAVEGIIHRAADLDDDNLYDLIVVENDAIEVYTTADALPGEAYAVASYSTPASFMPIWGAIDVNDLNGDDELDIAFGMQNNTDDDYRLGVWTNGTTGIAPYESSISPNLVATGNLNTANEPEILVSDASSYDIFLRTGEVYTPQGSVLTDVSYLTATTSDINGDTYPDLLAASPNALTVRYGDQNGDFGTELQLEALPGTTTVAQFAELTGDEYIDLVITGGWGSQDSFFLIYAGTANDFTLLDSLDTFAAPFNSLQDVTSILAHNMDGDDDLDLVITSNLSDAFGILTNNGTGSFTASTYSLPTDFEPIDVAAGALDAGTTADLIFLSDSLAEIAVLPNNGNGTFAAAQTYSVGISQNEANTSNKASFPLDLAVGDINGDGWLDIAVANNGRGEVGIQYNQQNGLFDNLQTVTVEGNPYQVAIGDFNGDSRNEIATAWAGDLLTVNEQVVFLVAQFDPIDPSATPIAFTTQGFSQTTNSGAGTFLEVVDANGDDSPDILATNDESIHILTNNIVGPVVDGEVVLVIRDKSTSSPSGLGESDLPPEGLTWFDEWTPVYVEFWGIIGGQGISDFDLAFEFNTSYHVADGGVELGPGFQNLVETPGTGQIQIQGQASTTQVGDSQYALLARVLVTPLLGNVPGVAAEAPLAYPTPVANDFVLTSAEFAKVGGGDVLPTIINDDPGLWAVPFDSDDTGIVDILDLLSFIDVYSESVATSTVPNAGLFDYDRSGLVDILDLLTFIDNYGLTNTDAQTTSVIYPPGGVYPDGGEYDTLMPAPAPAAYMYSLDMTAAEEEKAEEEQALLDLIYADYGEQ
jgi:hypothetical protein